MRTRPHTVHTRSTRTTNNTHTKHNHAHTRTPVPLVSFGAFTNDTEMMGYTRNLNSLCDRYRALRVKVSHPASAKGVMRRRSGKCASAKAP